MKCPFDLPVKKVKSNIGTYYVIENRTGAEREIGFDLPKKQADYIVQAINSHEKFKIALENIVSLETECCPRCEGSGRLWADGKAHHQHEQVDTISCGNCGGSGRILPEDAQVIASKALKEVGENQ